MTTATRRRSSAGSVPRPKAAEKVTPDDVLAIANDVAQNVLIERANEMRTLVLGALAGVNVGQEGPPGTAKSLGLRAFSRRISGARYFEKPGHPNMPADALIGGYDMPRFAKTGEFVRAYEHGVGWAHVGFIDEVFRLNGPATDSLLPIANTEERVFEANGGMKKSPLLFLVFAWNFKPGLEDPQFSAIIDRVTLMQRIEPVKADESFKEMFERHHERRVREIEGREEMVTISLVQFQRAQVEVAHIRPTAEFKEQAAVLRRKTREEGLYVSDRRWMELGRVCRASAWLAGRDHLIAEDLGVLEPGIWRDVDQIALARKLVLPYQGRYEREAQQKRQEAEKAFDLLEQVRGPVEATPPSEQLDRDLLTSAVNASRQVDSVRERVLAVIGEAENEQRDASGLRDLQAELDNARKWFYDNKLPTSYKP